MKPLGALGLPLVPLFATAAAARRCAYRRGLLRSYRPHVPVVSVGNLSAGGTGKTPAVAWLGRSLEASRRRPVILTRGYGGGAGAGPVLLGGPEGVRPPPEVVGDEPAMLAGLLPGVPLVVGSERAANARWALENLDPGCLILDDGMQHLALARDLEIVCVDARLPPWRDRLLPAGNLREGPRALARADLVLLTRCDLAPDHAGTVRRLGELSEGAPVLRCRHAPGPCRDLQGRPVAASAARVLGFAGIASPEAFRLTLAGIGAEVVGFRSFPDHHPYSPRELADLAEEAARAGAAAVVTTEKDAARIAAGWPGPLPLWTVGIRLDMMDPSEPLLARLEGLFHAEVNLDR